MMLKRLNHTLVIETVTDHDGKPEHEALLHTRPFEVVTQRELELLVAHQRTLGSAPSMRRRARPRPANVPAMSDTAGVAPTFEGEAANEAGATEADYRAQHAELGFPFVAQHEEDVHEQQDPGKDREAADRGIELRERLAREIGVVEHTLLHVVDVGGQPGNLRLEHGHDGVGEFRPSSTPRGSRPRDERLRGFAVNDAARRRRAQRSCREKQVVRGRLRPTPEAGDATLRQDVGHLEPGFGPVPGSVDLVADINFQRAREVLADRGSCRALVSPRRCPWPRDRRRSLASVAVGSSSCTCCSARRGSVVVADATLAAQHREYAIDVGIREVVEGAARQEDLAVVKPSADTSSSTGPSWSWAPTHKDAVNESPTTKLPVMIAVPSNAPSTTSNDSRGLDHVKEHKAPAIPA